MQNYMPKDYINLYSTFRNHPFINSSAHLQRWTISGKIKDSDKAPLDFVHFMNTGTIIGAKTADNNCLVDLDTLHKYVPLAANFAYYVQSTIDNFVVLDIEPECPEDLKQEFLQMNYKYAETSMSGKGIHLIFDLPACLIKYPDAQGIPALRHPSGAYEILTNHYVTFTGKILNVQPQNFNTKFDTIFEDLAKIQKPKIIANVDLNLSDNMDLELPKTQYCSTIIDNCIYYFKKHYKKQVSDFPDTHGREGDYNSYEFSIIVTLYNKLLQYTDGIHAIKREHTYSDNEKLAMLYHMAKQVVPYRPKHNQFRYGMPWLLYVSSDVMKKYQPNLQTKEDK